jgi:hypothetical protein
MQGGRLALLRARDRVRDWEFDFVSGSSVPTVSAGRPGNENRPGTRGRENWEIPAPVSGSGSVRVQQGRLSFGGWPHYNCGP